MHESDEQIEPDTPAGEEIELLAILIGKYERVHFPIDPPDPVEAILFHMDQMNLKQRSLRTIALLHENLGIPLESLVRTKRTEQVL